MLIPDYETKVDYLNCEAISRTVVEVLESNRGRPLTLGIHGDWGAGKSSVLKMIEDELTKDKNVAVLWFNGWTFEGFDDARTILIESTITELCKQRSTVGKVKELSSQLLRRVDWLKIAKRGGGLAFNVLTGMPSPDQVNSAVAGLKGLAQDASTIAPDDISAHLETIGGFLKPGGSKENLPETIHAFREEFQKLLDEAKVSQFVVLIDDLDRCLPETAIQTLEAIRLFLFVPKTAFVIGADEAMIEYAVKRHFPDLPTSPGSLPYARSYLEKLVQVPFRIPALGAQETRAYVMVLLVQSLVGETHPGFVTLLKKAKETFRMPWLRASLSHDDVQAVDPEKCDELNAAFVLAQQIGPILAEGTKGNPRQIKRFLNTLMLRQMIARARGFGDLVSQPVLAKLMLAERFQPDFFEHISGQAMASDVGKAADVRILERPDGDSQAIEQNQGFDAKRVDSTSETEAGRWTGREWLTRWVMIQPALADLDLRPYVFVVSDDGLRGRQGGQSKLESLIGRLCGSQLEIRSVEPEVKGLTSTEAENIFAELRERVLGAGNFLNPPKGVDGLSIIAKHHPSLQGEVVRLLGSLDSQSLGLWVVKGWNESIKEATAMKELRSVMQGWTQQKENKALKAAATAALKVLTKETV